MDRQTFDTALRDHIGEIATCFESVYKGQQPVTEYLWQIIPNIVKCEQAWQEAEQEKLEEAWTTLGEIIW